MVFYIDAKNKTFDEVILMLKKTIIGIESGMYYEPGVNPNNWKKEFNKYRNIDDTHDIEFIFNHGYIYVTFDLDFNNIMKGLPCLNRIQSLYNMGETDCIMESKIVQTNRYFRSSILKNNIKLKNDTFIWDIINFKKPSFVGSKNSLLADCIIIDNLELLKMDIIEIQIDYSKSFIADDYLGIVKLDLNIPEYPIITLNDYFINNEIGYKCEFNKTSKYTLYNTASVVKMMITKKSIKKYGGYDEKIHTVFSDSDKSRTMSVDLESASISDEPSSIEKKKMEKETKSDIIFYKTKNRSLNFDDLVEDNRLTKCSITGIKLYGKCMHAIFYINDDNEIKRIDTYINICAVCTTEFDNLLSDHRLIKYNLYKVTSNISIDYMMNKCNFNTQLQGLFKAIYTNGYNRGNTFYNNNLYINVGSFSIDTLYRLKKMIEANKENPVIIKYFTGNYARETSH